MGIYRLVPILLDVCELVLDPHTVGKNREYE
jgi:hypothetical protein